MNPPRAISASDGFFLHIRNPVLFIQISANFSSSLTQMTEKSLFLIKVLPFG